MTSLLLKTPSMTALLCPCADPQAQAWNCDQPWTHSLTSIPIVRSCIRIIHYFEEKSYDSFMSG